MSQRVRKRTLASDAASTPTALAAIVKPEFVEPVDAIDDEAFRGASCSSVPSSCSAASFTSLCSSCMIDSDQGTTKRRQIERWSVACCDSAEIATGLRACACTEAESSIAMERVYYQWSCFDPQPACR